MLHLYPRVNNPAMTSSPPKGRVSCSPIGELPPKEDDISAFNSSTSKLMVFLNAAIKGGIFCGKIKPVVRAFGSAVERLPDGPVKGTYKNIAYSWADGSVVERVPDKNKVDGSIPSRPTSRTQYLSIRRRCKVRLLERPLGMR